VVPALAAVLAGACNGEFRFDNDPEGSTVLDGGDAGGDGGFLCTSDQSCGDPALHCATDIGECLACFIDAHCTDPSEPYCHLLLHRCVSCRTDADCGAGESCERDTRQCIHTCHDEADCPDTYAGCDEQRGLCVHCRIDADCSGARGRPYCERHSGRCVECTDDTLCPDERPQCDPIDGVCVGCTDPDDCALVGLPICRPASWTCSGPP
jgi:Cys-rich repeat protein